MAQWKNSRVVHVEVKDLVGNQSTEQTTTDKGCHGKYRKKHGKNRKNTRSY